MRGRTAKDLGQADHPILQEPGAPPQRPHIGASDAPEVEPAAVEVVRVPPGTDLRRLAASISVPFTALHALNRVLVRGVTPPGRPWELRVPVGATDAVMTALDAFWNSAL